ncbi:PKS-NRPS hybrid synthetase cheA-like [Vigna angularis]|uniref:PKS-NRPS hybrid synthetase cheA-like n=1 Tax=Phaseolus angularis TaxID=3914 RepID=UPI0022B4B36F|nr:PKS-NRPS hybrid synthetase cheA-like [Vigna angularis]
MNNYPYLDSEINSDFILEFCYSLKEVGEGDYSDQFSIDKIFPTRADLIQWVRKIAFDLGFVVVTIRSDTATGEAGRKTFILLGCERSGKYKKYKADVQPSFSGTRKCECPFRLRGKPKGDGWVLKVMCGYHNHELAETLVGHPFAGRLNAAEQSILVDMTNSQVKPSNILLTLKEHNADNVTTIKQIYNARYTYKRSLRGSRTKMQQLMMLLDKDKYIQRSRCLDDSDVVSDLFWTYPDSVHLVNSFNIVFLMDTTYKTNKYRLPLLEIVGVTSTGLTFTAAFALLSSERQSNFTWALERFKGLLLTSEGGPRVIITDIDLALINAINNVFPETYQMLCTFHIAKNVRAKCKMLVDKVESVDVLMEVWQNVMDCDDQSMFSAYVHRLEYASSAWPLFFDYVNRTWIIPYKTYFVKAWTNKVMHLGNTTTNRVESAHWNLKRLLGSTIGDLCSCWDAMHNVIVLQHNKIKASFEKSLNAISDAYKGLIYRRLVGRVSRYALGLIADEIERVNKIGMDSGRCGCILSSTYDLPCACVLARYQPGIIPLGEIHVMWTRLSISGIVSNESLPEFSIDHEVQLVQERFNKVDIGEKVNIKQKMIEIACPEMTSMVAPTHKVKTKGAQKSKDARHERSTKRDPSYFEHVDTLHSMTESSSRKTKVKSKAKEETRRTIPMLNQFHPICHPFIVDVVDVVADGHCGYRCISAMLGLGEEAWPIIRHDIYQELTQWRDEYAQLVGSYDRLEELRQSLIVHDRSQVNAKKWMTIPDIGYAIANRYNVILVNLHITSEALPIGCYDLLNNPTPTWRYKAQWPHDTFQNASIFCHG